MRTSLPCRVGAAIGTWATLEWRAVEALPVGRLAWAAVWTGGSGEGLRSGWVLSLTWVAGAEEVPCLDPWMARLTVVRWLSWASALSAMLVCSTDSTFGASCGSVGVPQKEFRILTASETSAPRSAAVPMRSRKSLRRSWTGVEPILSPGLACFWLVARIAVRRLDSCRSWTALSRASLAWASR